MKVRFRWQLNYPGATYCEFQVVDGPEFCCKEMQHAWREQAIKFGGWHGTLTQSECNISFWYWHCYPEGAAPDLLQINFCPFCGKEIEMIKMPKKA